MTKEVEKEPAMPINTVVKVKDLAERLIKYCDNHIANCEISRSSIDLVCLFFIKRIIEFSRASLMLTKMDPGAPVSIAVMARAQLESAAAFAFIFHEGGTPQEIEKRALEFLKFAEYKHVKFFEDGGDLNSYRKSLPTEEQSNFDRRLRVKSEVEANFSAEQRNQRYPTWNGKTISATISETHGSHTCRWYSVMSLIAHGDPSMLHRSLTVTKEGFLFHQRDYGRADGLEWIRLMSRQLFASYLVFFTRHGPATLDDEGDSIGRALGFQSFARDSDDSH